MLYEVITIIPYRGSWLDFEFDPKDALFVRIDRRRKLPATILLRALGMQADEILDTFFENTGWSLAPDQILMDLVPERLRGETMSFEIKDPDGNVIVEAGRRITPRHIRQMQQAGMQQLSTPAEYLIGKALARDLIDPTTGEVIAPCNSEVTEDLIKKALLSGLDRLETLFSYNFV